MDFYVKESPNKTLLFESVPYPGKFVHLKFRGVKYQEFSIFLMVSTVQRSPSHSELGVCSGGGGGC